MLHGNGCSVREAQPWRRDTCDSGLPSPRRAAGAVFPRRTEAQDSLLAAGGAGDTSSRGPGPPPAHRPSPRSLASDLGGALQREKAAPRSAAEAERQPRSAASARRRAASATPSTPSLHHTRPLAASSTRRHARCPSPRLRLSRTARRLAPRRRPRLRGRGAEVSPGRRRAHLHVPETRRPLGVGRKTRADATGSPPLAAPERRR